MESTRPTVARWPGGRPPAFDDPDLLDRLESARLDDFDLLDFGVITTDRHGTVIGYNAQESANAGLRRERVLGRDLFVDVAPCIDNALVAGRYRAHDELDGHLDEQLDYVFTFAMRPTPVRLRLLAAAGSPRRYLVLRYR